MKAVRKLERGAGHLECVEMDEPILTSGKVKIKVAYCGLCGSDSHIIGGYEPPGAQIPIPITLGHEYSGTVSAVGDGVKKFAVGDRVTGIVTTGFCGKCQSCLSGDIARCQESKNIGYETDGAMAEFICMEEGTTFKLPDNVSFEEGAQVEPAAVAAHAVLELVDLKPSDTVVIMGAGPIGLLVLQFVKACGAKTILVDVSSGKERLDLGKKLGADVIFENDKCELIKEVRTMTSGKGVDHVFECSGADICITQAIMMTRQAGTIVELAITNPAGSTIKSFLYAVMNNMRIQFAYGHNLGSWQKALQLMADGKINTKDLVTHTFGFEECNEAVACNDSNKVKVLLHP
jgi:L-iditol 2-dehydrogenase